MKWHERRVGNVVVVDLDGSLTLGAGDVQLRQVIRGLLDRGEKLIVLDFGRVRTMDSVGVGELIGAFSTAESRGASVKLLHLTSKIRDLLQFTQLISIFECYSDELDAVASFE